MGTYHELQLHLSQLQRFLTEYDMEVMGHTEVMDHTEVTGHTEVMGHMEVTGHMEVMDHTEVMDHMGNGKNLVHNLFTLLYEKKFNYYCGYCFSSSPLNISCCENKKTS